ALIMVLAAITVLTVMLAEFQDESSAELSGALSDRDALRAEYMARSGIQLARLLIAAEPTIRQAIAPLFLLMSGGKGTAPQIPVWEFSDRVLGAFNDSTGNEEFQSLAGVDLSQGRNLGIEGGRFELVIVDEDSKINVNMASRGDAFSQTRMAQQLLGLMAADQYKPMFEERDIDDQYSDALTICSAFIDWADPDENYFNCDPRATVTASATAPEDSFYQMLKVPYRRKNAAFDSLEEIRMVRGVGDDFWATFVDPEPGNPKKRVMTVWGQGQVNVNTANAQTIWAIVCAGAPQATICVDPAQAQTFLTFFSMAKGFTMGAPLFFSPKAFVSAMKGQGMVGPILTSLGIEPVQFLSEAETVKMVATESKVFSIYADGVVPGYRRETRTRIHAVVDFRTAPAPGFGPGFGADGSAAGSMGNPPGSAAGSSQFGADSSSLGEGAIQGAVAPNPGGTIIYWRME
ncbi:MAG TPA: type II secretion system protein GspK, partial [Polyangiaceae bacterium]|nr:type II secretion system protein GspK [Polyangiaceae bacterium]